MTTVRGIAIAIAFMRQSFTSQITLANELGVGEDLPEHDQRETRLEILRRVKATDQVDALAAKLGLVRVLEDETGSHE